MVDQFAVLTTYVASKAFQTASLLRSLLEILCLRWHHRRSHDSSPHFSFCSRLRLGWPFSPQLDIAFISGWRWRQGPGAASTVLWSARKWGSREKRVSVRQRTVHRDGLFRAACSLPQHWPSWGGRLPGRFDWFMRVQSYTHCWVCAGDNVWCLQHPRRCAKMENRASCHRQSILVPLGPQYR